MDVKSLHQAIQELRAELERVNLAIQRIEAIAAAGAGEQQTGADSSGPKAAPEKRTRRQD